ncbi:MAG: hypothetical protein AVDCRST_MAG42-973 [uncultured Chthoniobacterales bacterium]|uniref:Metallo-beta-lactamase domain-containing protein n=1 Tax=uncultured Chthoniobacterales bacterium TaxID=1836801 RepID=A0A6J4HQL5_9BACT|nr:MAG: hypothetical protein AVDCRST_MAG42-973 [uncultured Chthoniobacterales bacterium]
MSTRCVINVDLADVWKTPARKDFLRTLAWGDEVVVVGQTAKHVEVEFVFYRQQKDGSVVSAKTTGYICPSASSKIKPADVVTPFANNTVLKVHFVDVQQGDGTLIEAPDGKTILVDGGDNQLFARYLAARYRATSDKNTKHIDCVLVTHGDADHFAGLVEIYKSEQNKAQLKRLFMQPARVYHNGLVKRPKKKNGKTVSETDLLGPTAKSGKKLLLTGLVDDLLAVPDAEMNEPFREWKEALQHYHQRSRIEFRRLAFGDKTAFDFFNTKDWRIELLGPITEKVAGKAALRFLGEPPRGPRVGQESLSTEEANFGGASASHTINGHSIVFRLVYGNCSFLFSGDLNDEASRFLLRQHLAKKINLEADVFKVPHHGSADFSGGFFNAVSPVVSVVSSGDESSRKEYMHPRSTLMGALGKSSRVAEPLIFVTELVAFFQMEGWSRVTDVKKSKTRGTFFGFSRAAFGIVKTRTDGKRLFVYTDSGNVKMKEAYAYDLHSGKAPTPAPVRRA